MQSQRGNHSPPGANGHSPPIEQMVGHEVHVPTLVSVATARSQRTWQLLRRFGVFVGICCLLIFEIEYYFKSESSA